KKEFHASHASGLGDGTDLGSGVPDEKHRKTSGTDEGMGDSREEDKYDTKDDDDNDDTDANDDDDGNDGDYDDDANDDDNQQDKDMNDDNEETDKEKINEEEDDEVTKELYNDVNMNLGNGDADMTGADQGGVSQQNVSQELGFEQVEEDVHVTLTLVLDTRKTDELVQSSFLSSNFTSKLINLENPSLADNEITSLMDIIVRHEELGSQTSSLTYKKEFHASHASGLGDGTDLGSGVPDEQHRKTSGTDEGMGDSGEEDKYDTKDDDDNDDTDANDDDDGNDGDYDDDANDDDNQQDKDMNDDNEETNSDRIELDRIRIPIFNQSSTETLKKKRLMKKKMMRESDIISYVVPITAVLKIAFVFTTTIPPTPPFFNPLPQQATPTPTPTTSEELLEAIVLARSSSQLNSTYEVAESLSEFDLIKILIDKMEKNKSYDKVDYKRDLYDALVKSYQTNKNLFDICGEVFTLKRSRDDRDKDQDPSAGSGRGMKRRKLSKEAESFKDSRLKEKKSSSSSKDASHTQHKPSSRFSHAEEPSHIVDDLGVQQNQEFDTGNNDEQPAHKEVSKAGWFKKLKQPPTPDPDWNKRQQVDF
nr:hypothetical protein [Tanacetum cinerariifolium]